VGERGIDAVADGLGGAVEGASADDPVGLAASPADGEGALAGEQAPSKATMSRAAGMERRRVMMLGVTVVCS